MRKSTKWVLYFCAFVVFVHSLVYFILNAPSVQKMIVDHVNKNILQSNERVFSFQRAYLSFITADFYIDGVNFEIKKEQTKSGVHLFSEKIVVDFHLIRSILTKSLVADKVTIRNSAVKIDPVEEKNVKKNSFDLFEFLNSKETQQNIKLATTFLPSLIEIKNLKISVDNQVLFQTTIDEAYLQKNEKSKEGLSWQVSASNLRLKSEKFFLKNYSLFIKGGVSAKGNLNCEKLEIKNEHTQLDIKGGISSIDGKHSAADFNISGTLDTQNLFQQLGFDGSGLVTLSTRMFSTSSILFKPVFNGKMNWKNLGFDGFRAFDGEGKIQVTETHLKVTDLDIQSPTKGQVNTNEFILNFDEELSFQANANIQNLKFTELMSAVSVDTQAMEFGIDAQNVKITGKGIDKKSKEFYLHIDQPKVNVSSGFLPSLGRKEKDLIGKCSIDLKLIVDRGQMDVSRSILECSDPEIEIVDVKKGTIKFDTGKTDFQLEAEGAHLTSLEYFLKAKSSGVGRVVGTVTGTKKDPVVFQGDLQIKNGHFYGNTFASIDTKIYIDDKNLLLSEAHVQGNEYGEIEARLKELLFLFEGTHLQLQGTISGNIHTRMFTSAQVLPEGFPDAWAETFSPVPLKIEIPVSSPQKFSMHIPKTRLKNLQTRDAIIKETELTLNCTKGSCQNSDFLATQIISKKAAGNQTQNSKLLFKGELVSGEGVKGKLDAQAVPMSLFQPFTDVMLRGNIYASLDLKGLWKAFKGDLKLRIDGFQVDTIDFGVASLNAQSFDGRKITGNMQLKYSQVLSRFEFLQASEAGLSTVWLNLKNFDLSSFLSPEWKQKYNLYARCSGEFELTGISPFRTKANSVKEFLKQWKGNGNLQELIVQYAQVSFALKEPREIELRNGRLDIKNAIVLHDKSEMQTSFSTQLLDNFESSYTIRGNLNLSTLEGIFSEYIGASTGGLFVQIHGSWSSSHFILKGRADLRAETINLKQLSPPLQDVRGRLKLDGTRIELETLTAKKGNGTVNADGSLSWEKVFKGESMAPSVSLRLGTSQAQFRFGTRIFRSIDAIVDSTLEVRGNSLPYLIAGQVRLKRVVATKDASCPEIVGTVMEKTGLELEAKKEPIFKFNLDIVADKSIFIQTSCLKANLSGHLMVSGPSQDINVLGDIKTHSGNVTFQKRRYEIRQMEVIFDSPVHFDPRLDWEFYTEVSSYRVYVKIDGRLSGWRTDLWTDPPNLPDGTPFLRQDILRMLSSGVVPGGSTTQGGGYVIANTAAGILVSPFDDPLTETFSRLTGGFFDSVQLRPAIEEGQSKVLARFTRSLGERINLSVDVDLGPSSNNNTQSMRGTWLLNRRVNLLGELDRRNNGELGSTNEFLGGVRFQFGGE